MLALRTTAPHMEGRNAKTNCSCSATYSEGRRDVSSGTPGSLQAKTAYSSIFSLLEKARELDKPNLETSRQENNRGRQGNVEPNATSGAAMTAKKGDSGSRRVYSRYVSAYATWCWWTRVSGTSTQSLYDF